MQHTVQTFRAARAYNAFMLRALLASVLAVASLSSLAACSKDSGAPAVSANAVVGKVIAATGKVEAARGGQTRTLGVGSEVYGDDEVITGTDGSVQIHLAHNNARWALESGRRGKVQESASWTLAKVDTPPAPVEHATSAAGREGERSAATSSTTEVAAGAASPALPEEESADVPATDGVLTREAPEPSRVGKTGGGGGASSAPGTVGAVGKGGGTGATVRLGVGRTRDTANVHEQETEMPPRDAPRPPPPSDLENQEKLRKVIHAQLATLRTCPGAAGVRIKVTVARSTAKAMIIGGSPPDPGALKLCLDTKLGQLRLQQAPPFDVMLDL